MYNEKRYVGMFVYLTVLCGHIPSLFSYFMVFRYPYILLHFFMFFSLVYVIFLAAADALLLNHRVTMYIWSWLRASI